LSYLRAIVVACLGFWVASGTPIRAQTPIFYAQDGLAIRGYDAVAYFRSGEAAPGQAEIAIIWKGVVWRFVSKENLQQFEANPRAYAPQFGGYCAYSVSQGHVSTADPAAWEIVEGRLYLTNSPSVHRIWARDKQVNIALGHDHWPAVLGR
jgi:YHS domain-containing protein